MQNISGIQTNEFREIQDSQYPRNETTKYAFVSSSDNNKEYHYIDLLAIIQNIDIPN